MVTTDNINFLSEVGGKVVYETKTFGHDKKNRAGCLLKVARQILFRLLHYQRDFSVN